MCADNYFDLRRITVLLFSGKYKETDMCCRNHDHCPYFLDHFEEKYHLRNPYPWTLSHCDCDDQLFKCLKVGTIRKNVMCMFSRLLFVLLSFFNDKMKEKSYTKTIHTSIKTGSVHGGFHGLL